MLPNASDLYSFLEVSKTKNMSRASERIGITQPALSQGIKRLEHAFGQQLLLRSKGGVTLTKAGEKLAHNARDLLNMWGKLKDEAGKDSSEIRGVYSIGMHPAVANYTVGLFAQQVMLKYPNLELRFLHDLSRKITELIVSFKVDLAIVVNPYAHPDLVIKELFKDEVTFWKSKKTNANNDLNSDSKVLIVDPDLLQSQELLAKLAKKKLNFKRVIHSSNLEVVKKLTMTGAGIGVIPGRVVGQSINKMELVDSKLPKFNDRICLIYRVDMQKSIAAKSLIDFIFTSLKDVE